MSNSVSAELNTLLHCAELGILCGVIFDFFRAWRYGKSVNMPSVVIQDLIYFAIITCVIFKTIFNTNGAQLRLYMPIVLIAFFVMYRVTFSNKILCALVAVKSFLKKVLLLVVKLLFFPVKCIVKILLKPFLAIKRKLLQKKVKIALTFSKICFKIKCNVGMLFSGKKDCEERKPCRRKRKPEKRV